MDKQKSHLVKTFESLRAKHEAGEAGRLGGEITALMDEGLNYEDAETTVCEKLREKPDERWLPPNWPWI